MFLRRRLDSTTRWACVLRGRKNLAMTAPPMSETCPATRRFSRAASFAAWCVDQLRQNRHSSRCAALQQLHCIVLVPPHEPLTPPRPSTWLRALLQFARGSPSTTFASSAPPSRAGTSSCTAACEAARAVEPCGLGRRVGRWQLQHNALGGWSCLVQGGRCIIITRLGARGYHATCMQLCLGQRYGGLLGSNPFRLLPSPLL